MNPKSVLLYLSFISLAGWGIGGDNSPELDVQASVGEAAEARLTLPVELALYETHRADRVLRRLPAGLEVVVLGMDAHGLKIRAESGRTLIRGWVSRKLALGQDGEDQGTLEAWYQRELAVADLVTRQAPALNLTTSELERIFGPPSRRSVDAATERQGARERLEWIRTEDVDFGKSFGGLLTNLDKNSPLARVETGRLSVEVIDGVSRAIDGALTSEPAVATPEVSPPLPCPFAVVAVKPAPQR